MEKGEYSISNHAWEYLIPKTFLSLKNSELMGWHSRKSSMFHRDYASGLRGPEDPKT